VGGPGSVPRPNELQDGAAPNRLPPAADPRGPGPAATSHDAGFALIAPMIGCLGVLAGYLVAGLVAAQAAGLGPGSLVGAARSWIGCAAGMGDADGADEACSLEPGQIELGGAVFVAIGAGVLAWYLLDAGIAWLARLLGRRPDRRDDPGRLLLVAVVVVFAVSAAAAFYFTTGPDVLGLLLPVIAAAMIGIPVAALALLDRRDHAQPRDAPGPTGEVFIAMGRRGDIDLPHTATLYPTVIDGLGRWAPAGSDRVRPGRRGVPPPVRPDPQGRGPGVMAAANVTAARGPAPARYRPPRPRLCASTAIPATWGDAGQQSGSVRGRHCGCCRSQGAPRARGRGGSGPKPMVRARTR
jgi:hypothetical protein